MPEMEIFVYVCFEMRALIAHVFLLNVPFHMFIEDIFG